MLGPDLKLRVLESRDNGHQHGIANEAEMGRQLQRVVAFEVFAVVVLTPNERDFVQDVAGLGLKQRAVGTVAQQQGPANACALMTPNSCTADRLDAAQGLESVVASDGLDHLLEEGRAVSF